MSKQNLLVRVVILCLLLVGLSSVAQGYVMNFQGRLDGAVVERLSAGKAAPLVVPMRFRLYSVPTGGTALWDETHPSVPIAPDGSFNVQLGSVMQLDPRYLPCWLSGWCKDLFIGVAAGPDPEMTPRFQMTDVPTSMFAHGLDGFQGIRAFSDSATDIPSRPGIDLVFDSLRRTSIGKFTGYGGTEDSLRYTAVGPNGILIGGRGRYSADDPSLGGFIIIGHHIIGPGGTDTTIAFYADTCCIGMNVGRLRMRGGFSDELRLSPDSGLNSFTNHGRLRADSRGIVMTDSMGDTGFVAYPTNPLGKVGPATGSPSVGIGTGHPSEMLTVAGKVYSTIGGFVFPDGSTQTTAAADACWICTGNVTYLSDNTDNVGIGTAAPTAKLDVDVSGVSGVRAAEFRNNWGGIGVSVATVTAQNTNPAGIALYAEANSTDATVVATNTTASGVILKLFGTGNAVKLRVNANGTVGVNTDTPTANLDVAGTTGYNQLRMRTSYTPTSSADANGNVGDMAWDANYVYVKTAGGWKRSALSAF